MCDTACAVGTAAAAAAAAAACWGRTGRERRERKRASQTGRGEERRAPGRASRMEYRGPVRPSNLPKERLAQIAAHVQDAKAAAKLPAQPRQEQQVLRWLTNTEIKL